MLLLSKKHLEIHLSKEVPEKLSAYIIPTTTPLYGQTASGQYLFQKVSTPAYSVCIKNIFSNKQDTLVLVKEGASFCLLIQLENTLQYKVKNDSIIMWEWAVNLFYTPKLYAEIPLLDHTNYTTFALFLPDYLIETFEKKYPGIADLKKNSTANKVQRLTKANGVCSFEIMEIIYNVLKEGFATLTPELISDLLTKVFDNDASLKKRQTDLNKELIQKIYALKNFLQKNLHENYSRDYLLEKFDLSRYHFNVSFAIIYHATP